MVTIFMCNNFYESWTFTTPCVPLYNSPPPPYPVLSQDIPFYEVRRNIKKEHLPTKRYAQRAYRSARQATPSAHQAVDLQLQ